MPPVPDWSPPVPTCLPLVPDLCPAITSPLNARQCKGMAGGMMNNKASTARRHDLDWLRIAAFALLILYHTGMAFVPWGWHIKLARLDWLEPVMLFTNAWRLLLLFLISGIASAAMLEKATSRGSDGFLANRSKRLLLPLLFGVVLIVPPQPWVEVQVKGAWSGDYLAFWQSAYFGFSDQLGLILPTWNHLWFVVYLWAYTLLLALLPDTARALLAQGAGRLLAGHRLLWLPMLVLAAIRLGLADRFPETHDLVQDWAAHPAYGGAFFLGVAMGTAGPLWAGVTRWWKAGLMLGVAGWAVVALIASQPGNPEGLMLALSRAARAVQAWGMIIGLLGVAQRWLAFDHPCRQPLAEAVFPAYLIHQTIIILCAWWLLPLQVPLFTQAVLLISTTIIGTALFCWFTAHINWLRPWVGYGPLKAAAPAPLRA
jgi:glucans biosynthesis protein C